MLFEYIDKIRRKSDQEKGRFAFYTASVLTVVIFLAWILVLNLRDDIKGTDVVASVGSANSPVKSIGEVLSEVKDSIPTDVFSNFMKGTAGLKDASSTGF